MREPFLEPIVRQIRFEKVLRYIKANSSVVDIGCGHTPHLLNRLERYIRNGIGVDQLVKKSDRRKIKLISMLLTDKIPLRSNSADYVTLVAVLEHLAFPDRILAETHRILKRGGSLILTTPTHLNKPLLEFLAFRLGVISKREIAEHKKYFWAQELVSQLKDAGFHRIKHEYFELFLNNFVIAKK
jgi:ubiquinone/menaquinone biosynthesis C-methylase UbiE